MDLRKDKIINELRKIQGKELLKHSKATCQMAVDLAKNLNKIHPSLKINIKKIGFASLLHDWAKGFSKNKLLVLAKKYNLHVDEYEIKYPGLLHGLVGAAVVENILGIKDKMILNAIKNHTTGSGKMNIFEKIVFVADHIEINRDYRMVEEIRSIALNDFDKAFIMVIENITRSRSIFSPSPWRVSPPERPRCMGRM